MIKIEKIPINIQLFEITLTMNVGIIKVRLSYKCSPFCQRSYRDSTIVIVSNEHGFETNSSNLHQFSNCWITEFSTGNSVIPPITVAKITNSNDIDEESISLLNTAYKILLKKFLVLDYLKT